MLFLKKSFAKKKKKNQKVVMLRYMFLFALNKIMSQ